MVACAELGSKAGDRGADCGHASGGAEGQPGWGSPESEAPGWTTLAQGSCGWWGSFLTPWPLQITPAAPGTSSDYWPQGRQSENLLLLFSGFSQLARVSARRAPPSEPASQPASPIIQSVDGPGRPCQPQKPGRKSQGGVSLKGPTFLV